MNPDPDKNKLYEWLSHSWLPAVLVILAIILTLPSVTSGLGADDMIQREILLDSDKNAWTYMFHFAGDDALNTALRQSGRLSWWGHPELKVAFLRPVTVATHLLDYSLWPDTYWLQHLHSILWYALAVLAVALLYRRLIPAPAAAGLAALCFAIEDAHALPVGWIAHRNVLIATVFVSMTLLLHDRWRNSGRHRFLALALLMQLIGLLSAEAAVGGLAYIISYQCALEEGTWAKRIKGAMPYVLLLGIWYALYRYAGFGANGSDLYISPSGNPLSYARAVAVRAPMLGFSQFSQIPSDFSLILLEWRIWIPWVLSVLGMAGLGLFFLPLLRTSRQARFWALGMVLCLPPICATLPLDRMLFFAGIGAFGLIACQVDHFGWLGREGKFEPTPIRRGAMILMLILHAGLAGPLLALRSAAMPFIFEQARMGSRMLPNDLSSQTMVLLNGSDYLSYNLHAWRSHDGLPGPKRVALLVPVLTEFDIERVDDRTLSIFAKEGFFRHLPERATRDLSQPFPVGWHGRTKDFKVEVTETVDGRPSELRFSFHKALEDPSLRFFYTEEVKIWDFELPEVGERRRIRQGFEPKPE